MNIEPVTLTGNIVHLEPLQLKHAPELFSASQYPDLWRWMPNNPSTSPEAMERWITSALQEEEAGTVQAFVIVELKTGRIVGSTRYLNIVPADRGLEIGATWLVPDAQRTGVNTECKYLLLRHAFEVYGAIRVQFKTHHKNFKSQQAIERLGAVKEGILRNAKIMPDGSYRHSVYYSILEDEWPQVKANLEAKMHQFQYPEA
jgi:RimJ/RimL family protein N-acetyltransferase